MRYKTAKYALVLATGLMLSAPALASGDSPSLLVGTCISCHGPGGSSVGPATPSIAGMSKKLFVVAMKEYKEDKRPSTIMGRIARGYSTYDFKIMADYFAKQELVRHVQQVDFKQANEGSKLHKKYCKRCHKKAGFANKKGYLAGQWMPYLRFTLADFQNGERKTRKGKMEKKLNKMLKKKGEESLEKLVQFYGSQVVQGCR